MCSSYVTDSSWSFELRQLVHRHVPEVTADGCDERRGN